MSSLYVPVNVFLLFRRLVNVVSTLSISNQYFLYHPASPPIPNQSSPTSRAPFAAATPSISDQVDWPWWACRSNWDRIMLSDNRLKTMGIIRDEWSLPSSVLKSGAISLPWLGGGWSWPSCSPLSNPPQATLFESPPPMNNRKNRLTPKPNKEQKKKKELFTLPPELQDPKPSPPDLIHQLLANPALLDPIRTPRYPIVLCHGLYGFDTRGPSTFPSMRMHYWANVLKVLQRRIDRIISTRAELLNQQLHHRARGRGVNFLAHSMGGLDCRHLITHLRPSEYAPLSLMSIGTPHRGSPFMDWCADNIGIGKLRQQERDLAAARESSSTVHDETKPLSAKTTTATSTSSFTLSLASLPSSFTTLLLSIVDSPAYANLTSSYLNDVFNPNTPDDPKVKYFSVAGRLAAVNIWHPFWLPKMVLDGVEEKERGRLKKIWEEQGRKVVNGEIPLWANEREWGNDGLVTVQSAKWGEFMGIMEGADHWEMRGARGIEFGVDLPAIPAIGLGGPGETANGDGWGLNWGRLVGARKKEQSIIINGGKSSRELSDAQRQRDRDSDDEVVKSSTDRLSFVVDWLIEQIPGKVLVSDRLSKAGEKANEALSGVGRSTGEVTHKMTEVREKVGTQLRDAVAYSNAHIGVGDRKSAEGTKEAVQVSEMKKRMEKEGMQRKKNELQSKEDLERFYIALARKMYDEGL
ncbi:Alpha/Beta hydrolase protein [Cyathus striatus]|nr:Alpha/Beta hydrolase protein [Cyathus striatus]